MTTLTQDLLRPSAYGHDVDEVGFLQTHISLLFFAGRRVYKVKKPVDLGFLDYTTLAERKRFCEEEVRLNRRLAPDVYLGVVPIARSARGVHRIRGEGEVVEYAVEMVRLPAHRMLSELLAKGEIDNAKMNALASLLGKFHASAPTGEGVDEFGSPAVVETNAMENFEQLSPWARRRKDAGTPAPSHVPLISGAALDYLHVRQRDWLRTHRPLLERRVAEGRIRDGHGDLHAGNICVTGEGIVVYDCIEFAERFRCGDVAADLAFLTMDLDYRGYPAFSHYLSRRYAESTGDQELATLEAFYKTYRAIVRGKVSAIAAEQAEPGSKRRREHRGEAMRYLQLAQCYELPPTLVLMCGLPASGKSWLARQLAKPLRAAVLRSDVRRRTLSPAVARHASEGYALGEYAPDQKARTYEALLDGALHDIYEGQSVIVDATFSQEEYRRPFIRAAQHQGLPWILLHVTADEATTRERLAARAHDSREASQADLAVYLRELENFQDPAELPENHVLRLEAEGSVEERIQRVLDQLIAVRLTR